MIINKLSKRDYYLRIGVIIFTLISPIFYLLSGIKPSLSSYWLSDLQPIFILTNATTSYYLFSLKHWKMSAGFLLLLTAFSIQYYPMIHNILAGLFFISCLVPLYKNIFFGMKYFYSMLILLPTLFISIMLFETLSIILLCVYHTTILNRFYKSQKK